MTRTAPGARRHVRMRTLLFVVFGLIIVLTAVRGLLSVRRFDHVVAEIAGISLGLWLLVRRSSMSERSAAERGAALAIEIADRRALQESLAHAHDDLREQSTELAAQEKELRAQSDELAASQLELAARNEELSRAARLKSDFLASMSHELRTPLNAILGFSELLAAGEYEPLAQKQAKVVHDVHQAGQQLLALIDDILDLSRIESGHVQLHVTAFDLAAVATEAHGLLAAAAATKHLRLASLVAPGCFVVRADRAKTRQVLLNLLSNAVKFTPDGGQIAIEAETDEGRVRVSVRDSGIGIDPKDVPRLFQPFSQLDTGESRRFQGTGLGLSISMRLVELMGGSIGVSSELGLGSTFHFTLPLGDAPHAAIAAPRRTAAVAPAVRPGPGGGRGPLVEDAEPIAARARRVLIVDDSEPNRKVAAAMLVMAGCAVLEAGSAESAIELAQAQPLDAILMDVEMPGMSGLDATIALAADPRTRGIPVVVVSAHAMAGDAERALAAGAAAFVAKPVGRARLYEALDKAFGGSARWRGDTR